MHYLTQLAVEWATRSFGWTHVTDLPLRSLRILEEAVELCQAHGVPRHKMDLVLDRVLERPAGDPEQELGGVMMAVTVMCGVRGTTPELYLQRELSRVLALPPELFFVRNQEKEDLGLRVR